MKPLRATGVRLAVAASLLTLAAAGAAHAQQVAPPGWAKAWDFLVQNVCTDAAGRVLPDASPLDGPARCPRARKLAVGENLPYHKQDWPNADDDGTHPDGYQRSDSVPVRTALGLAVVQTYDFGDAPRAFGTFDDGDGGQVAFFSPTAVAIGLTEDGGGGLQFFLGPSCAPEDGWVIADGTFATANDGATLARITRDAAKCPRRLGFADTRWRVEPVRYRARTRFRSGEVVLDTLVSEHFGGRDVDDADHLERMYFTRSLGYTRWERWQNLTMHDRPRDRRAAAALAASGRCDAGVGPPASAATWAMTDCREWTDIVPAFDSAGDAPDFWLDLLRAAPATRAMFAAP